MDKLLELQEKKRTLYQGIKELRDKFTAGGDKWADAAEAANWKRLNDEFDSCDKEMAEVRAIADVHARGQELQEREAKERHTPNPRTGRMPGQHDPAIRSGDRKPGASEEERCLALQGWVRSGLGKALTKQHRSALRKVGLSESQRRVAGKIHRTSDFRSLQTAAGYSHPSRRREALSRAMETVAMGTGGGTVPQGFINSIELNMLAFGGVLGIAEVIRTDSGGELPWPTADDTSNEGEIVGQSADLTASSSGGSTDPTIGAMILRGYKFSSKPTKAAIEFLEDSAFDFANMFGQMHGERLARVSNRKFTLGSGVGEPKGIVTAAVQGVETASPTAIEGNDIVKLFHSIDPAYRDDTCVFMAHDSILLQVRLLKDLNGQWIWHAGLEAGVTDRMMGHPVVVNQHMDSTLASLKKVLLFGQGRKYKIRQIRNVRVRRLVERYAEYDQEAFLSLLRQDGNLLNAGTPPVKYLQMKSA